MTFDLQNLEKVGSFALIVVVVVWTLQWLFKWVPVWVQGFHDRQMSAGARFDSILAAQRADTEKAVAVWSDGQTKLIEAFKTESKEERTACDKRNAELITSITGQHAQVVHMLTSLECMPKHD